METKSWEKTQGLRIAVIGGGVAGITAAYCLSRRHRVTLMEREGRLGGHTYTVTVPDGPDVGLPVDMGFIVHNDRTYPLLNRLLDRLEVRRANTDMSFSYYNALDGFVYAGTGLNGLFARRSNLVNPSFWRMLWDIYRFCRRAIHDLEAGRLNGLSLGEYAGERKAGKIMMQRYLVPMASAIWSAPDAFISHFPAETFVRFFQNHGLMTIRDRPQWRYIPGGSTTYVHAFEKGFQGEVRLNTPVSEVRRTEDGVAVQAGKMTETYDAVVLASHADVSAKLLIDRDEVEQRALGTWRYTDNRVVLHTDVSFLPPVRRGWVSWNFFQGPEEPGHHVRVSYHMNRLQRLQAAKEYIVTLNPARDPDPGSVVHEVHFAHPQFSMDSLD
ncbi:MAG: NAD(P)/FAD-dependent oxidoreductase, partial [Desulfohalobiaceae bacterium]